MSLESTLEKINERAANSAPLGNTMKFDFGEQCFYLDGTGEKNVITQENKDADCTVAVSQENFQALLSGDLNPMGAFMSGKIKVSGDMSVAMKLQTLLG